MNITSASDKCKQGNDFFRDEPGILQKLREKILRKIF